MSGLHLVALPTLTIELDGLPPAILRRGSGLDLHLMRSETEHAPFDIHFHRRRVPVVDGWGFKHVTRWNWSIGWRHGREMREVSCIGNEGEPFADYAACRLDAITMAVAWMHSDDPKRFLDDQWRRQYGLQEAERLRRGIARVIETFGLG